MAGEQRGEVLAPIANGLGGASSVAFARTNKCITLVSQATSRPDPELTRLRQADEGHVSPQLAGGRGNHP